MLYAIQCYTYLGMFFENSKKARAESIEYFNDFVCIFVCLLEMENVTKVFLVEDHLPKEDLAFWRVLRVLMTGDWKFQCWIFYDSWHETVPGIKRIVYFKSKHFASKSSSSTTISWLLIIQKFCLCALWENKFLWFI